jgi:hypothetical protein
MEKNFCGVSKDIYVIYKWSHAVFAAGYEKVKARFPLVNWVEQDDFREDTMETIHRSTQFICFFVDDNIVYRQPEVTDNHIAAILLGVEDAGCFSLRLGLNTVIQDPYVRSVVNPMPRFETVRFDDGVEILAWMWNQLPMNNFGYPFSVDGHVYDKDLLIRALDYDFQNPNALEGCFVMKRVPPGMFACTTSSVVNNPLNLVGSSNNRAGETYGRTLEELNGLYMSNKQIKDTFSGHHIEGCHQEMEIEFECISQNTN